jgi:8-oxo-dGTP diphosphatase
MEIKKLMPAGTDARAYPDRPFLAVSAAIIRDGRVLIVRRAATPMQDVFTLPGGVVEAGETLDQAVIREVQEETGMAVEPVTLAGHREVLLRDADNRVSRHFVVLAFAARWLAGEFTPNAELAEGRWIAPEALAGIQTTEGLAEIITAAFARIESVA